MTIRTQCLTLAALSVIASVSIFVSASLVFLAIADEIGSSLLVNGFLPLVVALPFILIALRFFRKAASERAGAQMPTPDTFIQAE